MAWIVDDFMNNIMGQKNTEMNMHNQYVYDLARMRYQSALQRSQQEYLNNTLPGAQVSGMKNAGINPAGNSSTIGGVTAPSVPMSNGSVPQGAQSNIDMSGILQLANLKADLKVKNEQARGQQIENDTKEIDLANKRSGQDEYNTEKYYVDPDTGDRIDEGDLDAWSKNHPGAIPDLQVIKHKDQEGRDQANVRKQSYATQIREDKQKIDDAETRHVANKLERAVKNGQFDDKEILRAMQRLPKAEKERINALTNQLKADERLKGLQADMQEKTNKEFDITSLQGVLDTLKSSDAGIIEKLGAVVLFLANRKL